MGALIFAGAMIGFIGFGICGLGAAATLEQHGLADWKTALVWGLLAVGFLVLSAFSTCQAEKIGLRRQAPGCQECCKCRCCVCEKHRECIKGEDK